jgi:hypothetical protein
MQATTSATGAIWIKLAAFYLIVGVSMGIAMGASQDFTLRPVHAHVNLLGWATFALAGLIYAAYPRAAASKLAKVHFWSMNIALPVMMGALALVLMGQVQVVPALVASEFLAAAGIIAFAINVFTNLKD